MTKKEFIEKAIDGGWEINDVLHYNQRLHQYSNITDGINRLGIIESVILDPKAWEAVGKVEGWKDEENCPTCWKKMVITGTGYMCHMHRMIDALCEGKSIEQFLETL